MVESKPFLYYYVNGSDRSHLIESLELHTTWFERRVEGILSEPANEPNHLLVSQITDAIMCSLYR